MKNSELKLSIVMVTYNAERFIESALLSVFSSGAKNYELIIVDGQSMDSTVEIIERYKDKVSYFISEPDNGVYDAMNKAVNVSTGEWLYFLGADDAILDGAFNNLESVLKSKAVVYYGDVIFKSNLQRYTGKLSRRRLMMRNFPHQALFYPKSVFKVFRYNEEYKVLADYDLNLRLTCSYKFQYINQVFAVFNDIGGISYNGVVDSKFEEDRLTIFREVFSPALVLWYRIRRFLLRFVRCKFQSGKV